MLMHCNSKAYIELFLLLPSPLVEGLLWNSVSFRYTVLPLVNQCVLQVHSAS